MNAKLRILHVFMYQDFVSHTRILRVIESTVARLQSQFFFKNVKKKIQMDSEKSINSFEMKKITFCLPICY